MISIYFFPPGISGLPIPITSNRSPSLDLFDDASSLSSTFQQQQQQQQQPFGSVNSGTSAAALSPLSSSSPFVSHNNSGGGVGGSLPLLQQPTSMKMELGDFSSDGTAFMDSLAGGGDSGDGFGFNTDFADFRIFTNSASKDVSLGGPYTSSSSSKMLSSSVDAAVASSSSALASSHQHLQHLQLPQQQAAAARNYSQVGELESASERPRPLSLTIF